MQVPAHPDTQHLAENRDLSVGTVQPGWRAGRSGIARFVNVTVVSPPAPTVSSITAAVGTTAGGDAVVITGLNFVSGATIAIGGNAATSVVFVGTTQLNCTTPAHAAGAVNVVVTNPDTQTGTLTNGFTYQAPATFTTPDLINNESFESGGFGPFAGFGSPTPGPSGQVAVITAATAFGSKVVRRNIINTNGIDDTGGGLDIPFYDSAYHNSPYNVPVIIAGGVDRLWTRFYFTLADVLDGTLKLNLLFGASGYSPQFSGLYMFENYLSCSFTPESDGSGSIGRGHLVALSSLVGAQHYVEMDYWRNGDVSNGGNNYPSVAFWIDGTPITAFASGSPAGPASWINGRLNFGTRASSTKIGVAHFLGTLNGHGPHTAGPANTVVTTLDVDRIAVSSVGRIGP